MAITACFTVMIYIYQLYPPLDSTTVFFTVAVTKMHASRPRKDCPRYRVAPSHQYSVSSFGNLRVLSCLYSPGFCCSCCRVVRYCRDLEACSLVTATTVCFHAPKIQSSLGLECVRRKQKSGVPLKASSLQCRFLLRVTDPCNESPTLITTKPPHLFCT
jgi:hypothetical protein